MSPKIDPLRQSLFPNVPPFINYIPIPHDKQPSAPRNTQEIPPARVTPPVDLHDQLWRVCAAIKQLADDLFKLESIGQKFKFDKTYPFRKKPGQEEQFKGFHGRVCLIPFPSLHMLSKKDELWKNIQKMREQKNSSDTWLVDNEVGRSKEFWDFLPDTLILPDQWDRFISLLSSSSPDVFWIIKPSNLNRGVGIRVINNESDISDISQLQTSVCVQKYLLSPYLLANQLKFDLRIYVLVTSWDPIRIFLYKDGLVRFCSEQYNPSPANVDSMCSHITNPEVNKTKGRYVYNKDPNSCSGHKWRLKCFWNVLMKEGVEEEVIERAIAQIEEIVIKTLLSVDSDMKNEFSKKSSMYNCYSLTGFDILLDSQLTPHLLEVNTKPELLPFPLDSAVNKPMILEMFHIVGYHLPANVLHSLQGGEDIARLFKSNKTETVEGFDERLYSRSKDRKHMEKEKAVTTLSRDEGIDFILQDLTSLDLRILIKSEEELSQSRSFTRIFPTATTVQYLSLLSAPLSYGDKLLDAFEQRYQGDRLAGRAMISEYCKSKKHL